LEVHTYPILHLIEEAVLIWNSYTPDLGDLCREIAKVFQREKQMKV
jgi:hypothetical protein